MTKWSYSLFLNFFLSLCLGGQAFAAGDGALAKAVSLDGKVTILSSGTEHDLRVGDSIEQGSSIHTGPDGSAKILFRDQTVLDISPKSLVRLDQYVDRGGSDRDVDLGLDFGKARTSVNKKLDSQGNFKIRTKSTVFAVRGTEFWVEQDQTSRLTVFEGHVQAQSLLSVSASQMVNAGQQLSVSPTGAFSPMVSVAPLKMSEFRGAARVRDRTFTQAVVISSNTRTRYTGSSTLKSMSTGVAVPKIQLPRNFLQVPPVFVPSATLVNGNLINSYPVSTTVTYTGN